MIHIYAIYLLIYYVNVTYSPYPVLTLILCLIPSLIKSLFNYRSIRHELKVYRRHGKAGYLYGFFDVGNIFPAVKIGRETRKGERLKSHKTAAPLGIVTVFSVKVRDAVRAEAYLHYRYKRNRVRPRNEWFIWTLDMMWELIFLRMFGV